MTKRTVARENSLSERRTHLANERTLLAYLRTAVGCFAAAVGVFGLFENHGVWGWGFSLAGVAVALFGVVRYVQVSAEIDRSPPDGEEE